MDDQREPGSSTSYPSREPDPQQARALLRLLLETVTLLDAAGRVRWINLDDTGGILGYAPRLFAGRTLFELFHPQDAPRLAQLWEELIAQPGSVVAAHGRVRASDGTYQDAEGIAYNLLHDPAVRAVVVCTRNISRHVMAREASADAEAVRDLVEQAADLALLYGADLRLRWSTRATEATLGCTTDELGTIDDFLGLVHPDDRADIERRIAGVHGLRYGIVTADARLRHRHGTYLDFALRLGPPHLTSPDSTAGTRLEAGTGADGAGGVAITGDEVTEDRAERRLLEHRSLHDPLTDLPNRVLLGDRLDQACRRLTRGGQIVVAYIDIDHFKIVNDRHGHAAGDDVLVEVGRRLRGALRPEDTVARVGGDEFVAVAVVDQTSDFGDDAAPIAVAERLFGYVADAPMRVGDTDVHVSITIGVATASRAAADPKTLLEAADAVMLRAKRAGRARIERVRVDHP